MILCIAIDKNGQRIIPVEVFRYRGNSKPYTETFEVDTKDTPMVLDVLLKIKNTMDPTLTLRRSCREGICGSCSMNIGGTNTLACLCTLEEAITPDGKIRVYPLPHCTPIKDLVPDMNRFYEHHASVEPWLHLTPEQEKSKTENLQSPEDRAKLDGMLLCLSFNNAIALTLFAGIQVFTSVFCVLVVLRLALVTGGMEKIIIWVLLSCFKLSDGFPTPVTLQFITDYNN